MSVSETQALPAGAWAVDKIHSNVGFSVAYMAGTFTGRFSDFDAVVADGAVNGSAKVASVQVRDPNVEAHLQSPEFFDAERNPRADVRLPVDRARRRPGQDQRRDHDQGHTEPLEITGSISDPIADQYGRERFGLGLEAVVARDKLGLSSNNPLRSGEPALADEVAIAAQLQLAKQE
jgi:polyisoprenoid-binding protein YceI